MRVAAILLAVALIAGCVTSGTNVTESQIQELKKGQTTYSDALSIMGKPDEISRNSDGTRTATYSYAHSQVDGKTFIPYAGAFIGGSHGQTKTVTLNFDTNNVLKDYSVSEGTQEIRNGG